MGEQLEKVKKMLNILTNYVLCDILYAVGRDIHYIAACNLKHTKYSSIQLWWCRLDDSVKLS